MNDDDRRGDNSASKFRLISFNANSIGKNPKRGQVFHFLRKKRPDILIIVDTRISKDIENIVKAEWGGYANFASFDSQSRGVAILTKKDFPITFLDKFSDIRGNIMSVLVEIEGKVILIEGIYGPNRDELQFYSDEVFKRLSDWNPRHAIYAGDWNIALDPALDTLNYETISNPRAKAQLLSKMSELGLVDAYREFHPTERKYSWNQWGAHKFSRIDFFLTSNSLLPYIQKVDILPKCYSDHCPILIDIDFSKFTRGKGFWKMNNSLLYDPEYVDKIKHAMKKVTAQYAIINNDENFFINASQDIFDLFISEQTPETLQALPLKINPELFLDTLMMEVRRETILYSAEKKRERLGEEQLLNHDIEVLEHQLQQNAIGDPNIQAELSAKKAALENIYNYQAQGAFIRSRASYKVEGERPTRMFCALEKYNGTQKYVPQLIVTDEDGTETVINDQKEVEEEIHNFYKKLVFL